MRLNKIHHIAIICSDYHKSKRFYTEVIGLNIIRETYRPEKHSFKLDLGLDDKYIIELFSFPDAPQRRSYPEATGLRHIAFEVDDLDVTVKFLEKHGVPVEPVRTDEYTSKRFCFIVDPDGQPIEFYEQ